MPQRSSYCPLPLLSPLPANGRWGNGLPRSLTGAASSVVGQECEVLRTAQRKVGDDGATCCHLQRLSLDIQTRGVGVVRGELPEDRPWSVSKRHPELGSGRCPSCVHDVRTLMNRAVWAVALVWLVAVIGPVPQSCVLARRASFCEAVRITGNRWQDRGGQHRGSNRRRRASSCEPGMARR